MSSGGVESESFGSVVAVVDVDVVVVDDDDDDDDDFGGLGVRFELGLRGSSFLAFLGYKVAYLRNCLCWNMREKERERERERESCECLGGSLGE